MTEINHELSQQAQGAAQVNAIITKHFRDDPANAARAYAAVTEILGSQPQGGALSDEMVEQATMVLLEHKTDPAPGVDWHCDRQWSVNKVRQRMRLALSTILARASEPRAEGLETLNDSDVFTLIGHAEYLRGIGQEDMPSWCLGLAGRIAATIGDAALAQRVAALAAQKKGADRDA